MIKKLYPLLSLLLLSLAAFWSFYGSMPQQPDLEVGKDTEFSVARAMEHVEVLGGIRHYVGSKGHNRAQEYLVSQLKQLGLPVEVQKGSSLNKTGIFTKPKNILAKIEGSGEGKTLLLLTHYDSAVHSSFGASDAASGVATILEGIRAYMASGVQPKNDILIVFTDAEELGLNGAELFVREHPWAQNVGLALNFEARGSGGASFMLLETQEGNQKLIEHFIKAAPEYPVTNSLAYSVYKMLPNDTDLTVLREEGGITGFNFAFIDDHFDYHTALDTPENLDLNTLAHQGSYLMPLLTYFSQVPLTEFTSSEDLMYFDAPIFNMVSYPFSWNLPLVGIAVLLLIGVLVYGLFWRKLEPMALLKGFVPLLISLGLSGLLTFLLWKFCLFIYPEYLEMEHGFTYNGYSYIAAVIFLSLGVCFYTYHKFRNDKHRGEFVVAPLVLWILLCALATEFLPGAAYLIIPVFFGIIQLFFMVRLKRPNLILMSLLSLPAIFLLLPLISTFPVALGLGILFVIAILVVLHWVLIWPVFRFYRKLQLLGFLSMLTFFVLMGVAHFTSEFNAERPKPNSLDYMLDADKGTATWNTYDTMEDGWTAPFFEENTIFHNGDVNFSSKYSSGFSKSAKAPVIDLKRPKVVVQKLDSAGKNYRLQIIPQRDINRIEIFTEGIVDFAGLTVNGLEAQPLTSEENPLHIFKRRWDERLLTYYATDRDTLELTFSLESGDSPTEFLIYEASNDLLEQEDLKVPPREAAMIPRPFVLNDAVIIKQTVSLE